MLGRKLFVYFKTQVIKTQAAKQKNIDCRYIKRDINLAAVSSRETM